MHNFYPSQATFAYVGVFFAEFFLTFVEPKIGDGFIILQLMRGFSKEEPLF